MSDPVTDLLAKLAAVTAALPVAREAANTVFKQVVPIVVLPGIMGTRLLFDDGAEWDPDTDSTMVRDWVLETTPRVVARLAGNAQIVDETEDLGLGSLVSAFYRSFVIGLRGRLQAEPGLTCPVFACGYDWHKSNTVSAARLISFVQGISSFLETIGPIEKVILVTHSMGGLVARAACALDPAFAKRVLAVIHTGQPAVGVPVAYRRFLTGANEGQGFLGALADNVLGDTWWKYMAMASALPSLVQLLPTNDYVRDDSSTPWLTHVHGEGKSASTQPVDLKGVYSVYQKSIFPGVVFNHDSSVSEFTPFTWMAVQTNLRLRLDEAEKFHGLISGFAHPDTCTVASTHSNFTEVGLTGNTLDGAPFFRHTISRGIGDGTVPRASANAISPKEAGATVKDPELAQPRRRIVGLVGEHSKMLQDPDVLEFVARNIAYFVRKSIVVSPFAS